MTKNRKFKFLYCYYVYIVCSNFGAYMEPDIEILKVFISYKYAKQYTDYLNYEYDKSFYREPYFIIKKRVVVNE